MVGNKKTRINPKNNLPIGRVKRSWATTTNHSKITSKEENQIIT